jgi:hypothetical protein
MVLGFRVLHERATACHQRQPSTVGEPPDPLLEVIEVFAHVVQPLRAVGGLGYAAWVENGTPLGLPEALTTWFGPPAVA